MSEKLYYTAKEVAEMFNMNSKALLDFADSEKKWRQGC